MESFKETGHAFHTTCCVCFSVHHRGCTDVSQHGEADKRKACTDSLRARRITLHSFLRIKLKVKSIQHKNTPAVYLLGNKVATTKCFVGKDPQTFTLVLKSCLFFFVLGVKVVQRCNPKPELSTVWMLISTRLYSVLISCVEDATSFAWT